MSTPRDLWAWPTADYPERSERPAAWPEPSSTCDKCAGSVYLVGGWFFCIGVCDLGGKHRKALTTWFAAQAALGELRALRERMDAAKLGGDV
jgi:hypothetical protein